MKKMLTLLCILYLPFCYIHAQNWKLTGNSGINPAINFVGTTDAKPLLFKVASQKAGFLYNQSGSRTSFGYQALNVDTGINYNSAFGYQALLSDTHGQYNTAIGYQSLSAAGPDGNFFTTGSSNAGLGYKSLFSNVYGNANTALGSLSLYTNQNGVFNTATGANSLYSSVTGNYNTANGGNSLYSNKSGSYNTAAGFQSLYANTSGLANTAAGYYALYANQSGNFNTASGYLSLFRNTTGYSNVAIGTSALYNSQSNSNNVAIGDSALLNYNDPGFSDYMLAAGTKALMNNTTGYFNTATGGLSLSQNSSGSSNTANGTSALAQNTTGSCNTAVGYSTLIFNTTGFGNTAIGCSAGVNAPGLSNATAIGQSAIATASNQIMLGNSGVSVVRTYGAVIYPSDGRFKKNIKENVHGLDFINALKPVTYNFDVHSMNKYTGADKKENERGNCCTTAMEKAVAEKEKKLFSGFIAQDVEKAADKLGYDFSGVYKPQNSKDIYGLSYSEFVVPLVKAVQELSKMNDDKATKTDAQQQQIDELKKAMQQLQQSFDKCNLCSQVSVQSNTSLSTATIGGAALEQNNPNPFNSTTSISYKLPAHYASAQIVITDKQGKTLKQETVSGNGKGNININATTLPAGAYQYSLYVDGRRIGTKQMLVIR